MSSARLEHPENQEPQVAGPRDPCDPCALVSCAGVPASQSGR